MNKAYVKQALLTIVAFGAVATVANPLSIAAALSLSELVKRAFNPKAPIPYTISLESPEKDGGAGPVTFILEDPRTPPAEASGEVNYPSVTVPSVNHLVVAINNAVPAVIYQSEEAYGYKWHVEAGPTMVQVLDRSNNTKIFDLAQSLEDIRPIQKPHPDTSGDGPASLWSSGNSLLSMVGPLVSVEESYGFTFSGAANAQLYTGYKAYDLSKKAGHANLLDYFTEASFVKALVNDNDLTNIIKEKQGTPGVPTVRAFKEAKTWSEVNGMLGRTHDCVAYWDSRSNAMLSQFAIFDYNVKTNLASVRLGLSHGCEAARGMLTKLGLEVTPTEDFRETIQGLKESKLKGFFLSNRNNAQNIME